MSTKEYKNNWKDVEAVLKENDVLKASSLMELADNIEELKERLTYCSMKKVVLKVKGSTLEADVYLEILALIQRSEEEKKQKMHEAQQAGIIKALQKKESGEGRYGRPRVKLPKNFTQRVEECIRTGRSLESYRVKTKMKKSTFYKYAHIIKKEL